MPFAKSNGRGNLATGRPKEDNTMENWSEEQKRNTTGSHIFFFFQNSRLTIMKSINISIDLNY